MGLYLVGGVEPWNFMNSHSVWIFIIPRHSCRSAQGLDAAGLDGFGHHSRGRAGPGVVTSLPLGHGLHRKVPQRRIVAHIKLQKKLASFMENTVSSQRPNACGKTWMYCKCHVNLLMTIQKSARVSTSPVPRDFQTQCGGAEVGCIARPGHCWSTRSHGCHVGTRCHMDLRWSEHEVIVSSANRHLPEVGSWDTP